MRCSESCDAFFFRHEFTNLNSTLFRLRMLRISLISTTNYDYLSD